MDQATEKRYSITDLFFILKRRFILVVICVGICLLAALAALFFQADKEYTAVAILYVAKLPTTNTDSYQTPLSDLNYLQKVVLSYLEVLHTDVFLDQVAQASGLGYTAGQLANMLEFQLLNDTEYFQLAVVSNKPEDALLLAETAGRLAPLLIGTINSSDTIKLLSPAKLPTAPSGPSLFKYGLAGCLVGFFASLLLAMILHKTDRRVRDKSDLTRRFASPLLGQIRQRALAAVPGPGLLRSYKELAGNFLKALGPGPKSIIVTGLGADKALPSCSYQLARQLVQLTRGKILLLDCDWRQPAQAEPLACQQKRGLSQLLAKQAALDKLIIKTDLSRLDFICRGSIPTDPAASLASPAMQELLASLAARYDYILLDCPAFLPEPDALALAGSAAGVLLLIQQKVTSFLDIKLALGSFAVNQLQVSGLVLVKNSIWRSFLKP